MKRDPQVDKLTLAEAVTSQGFTLVDPKRWALRHKQIFRGRRLLFEGSHQDCWKWLWLVASGRKAPTAGDHRNFPLGYRGVEEDDLAAQR